MYNGSVQDIILLYKQQVLQHYYIPSIASVFLIVPQLSV